MFGQFRIVQPIDFNAFCNLVAVGAVHQLQPVSQDVVTPDEIAALSDGPAGRGHVDGQVFLDLVNDFKDIPAFAVHLVAEGQDWQISQAADLEQLLCLAFHALCTVYHHDRGIHRRQRAIGVFGEIRVARCVYKIETEVVVIKRHRRGGYRNTPVLFHLHEIRPRAPRFALGAHLTRHLDCAAVKQKLFGQRGFARIWVRDDGKGPTPGNFGWQGRAVGRRV